MQNVMNMLIHLGFSGGAAGGTSSILVLAIIAIPLILFFVWRKNKKNSESNKGPANRHKGDEVWKTVKDFLKQNDEIGQEIIETYVAKRPDEDFVDTSLPKPEQKKKRLEIKQRKKEQKIKNKELKSEGKLPKNIRPRELYVVLFTTRNAKTLVENHPRALECEVKMVKKNKYDTERKIIILGERDYDVESKWILPMKEAEEAKLKKEIEKRKKHEEKKKAKELKRKQKKIEKMNKKLNNKKENEA